MGTYVNGDGTFGNFENKVVELLRDIKDGYANPASAAAAAAAAAETAAEAAETAASAAAGVEYPVSYAEQELTDTQKGTARTNIGAAAQSQVADLKSTLSHSVEVVPSRNLYDPSNKMDGYQLVSSGNTSPNADYNFTGYIDISGCEHITVMLSNFNYPGSGTQSAFYNSAKTAITTRNELGNVLTGTAKTFTVPSGAQYFGLAYQAAHLKPSSTIMVQDGETPTEYEPYGDRYIVQPSTEMEKKPVVVYWGDSLTQGNQDETGVNRPRVLKSLLGNSWDVLNYGVGGEQSNTIAVRQSGMMAVVKAGQTIPANTDAVVLQIEDQNGDALNFRSGINVSAALSWGTVNPCVIAGVEGNLSRYGSSYSTTEWQFNRLVSGDAVQITRPTEIMMHSRTYDKNQVLIICIGQNEGWNRDGDYLVSQVRWMIEQAKAERFLIIGMPHTTSYSWQTNGNNALKLAFGKHYIDIEAYMKTPIYNEGSIVSSYALQDAGLTPTEEDLTAVANNQYPPSIMYDGIHFNQYGYTVWANREYKVGQWLGYWE